MMLPAVRQAFFKLLQKSLSDSFLNEVNAENPYFLPEQVRFALNAMRPWFDRQVFDDFSVRYPAGKNSQRVGIIMAGNVPLVGLHDLLAVLLTGHQAVVKLSHKDRKLMSTFIDGLPEEAAAKVKVVERISPFDVDFLIATGSGATARQLEFEFRGIPKLIRGNRFGVAILEGEEQQYDYVGLLEDMLRYHGMGCRSVSNLIVPIHFNPQQMIDDMEEIDVPALHPEWNRLVTWERSVLEMKEASCVAIPSLVFEQRTAVSAARPGVVHVIPVAKTQVKRLLSEVEGQVQVVVGAAYLPFGQAQQPRLFDFADNVDTFRLLSNL